MQMAEVGLGFVAGEEEGGGESRRRRRGRIISRWGSRRRGSARDGSADELGFYFSGHSSGDDVSFHAGSYGFASAPGSFGGRFSFGSDLPSLSPSPPATLTHLSVCESSFAQVLDPEPETRASSPTATANISSAKSNSLSASKEQGLVLMVAEEQLEGGKTLNPQSRTVSHSLSGRDCQNHRVTFESISSPGGQHRRWRPCSFDLNSQGQNVASSSLNPLSGGTAYTKNSCEPSMLNKSNMFPSPPTPNCWHSGIGAQSYQKGWSSERVPLPASRGLRYGGNTPLFPFNNGRTMPSKWEDAERWICSPVSGDGSRKPLMLPPYHRRPMSKSGPLGAPVLTEGSYPSASTQIPCFDNGRVVNFAGGSPFLAGVLVTDQQFCSSAVTGADGQEVYEGGENYCSPHLEACIDRSTSMHGWLDMLEPSTSLPSSDGAFQGDRIDSTKEAVTMISHMTWRRDVGTQMSPEGSTHSSTKERPSLYHSPQSVHTITELQGHFPCLEIRDVQVDDRVTVTRWSKKHISRCSDRRSTDIIEWKRKTVDSQASDWEVVDTVKHISKYDREEAKITAWENLQKAKAEAALHKLEMKLEKRRSSSMNKILNRLRSAQRKADVMRSSVVDSHLVVKTGPRISYFSKYGGISSLRSCFTCRAS